MIGTPHLCDHCKEAMVDTPQAIISHRVGDDSTVLPVREILAIESADKGQRIHMKDGTEHFEYLVLKDVLADYPGLFFRANRHWIVANDQVVGVERLRPKGHKLVLQDSALTVPVSRRAWAAVAARIGIKKSDHPGRPAEHMTHMRSLRNLTHNRTRKPVAVAA